MDKFTGTIGELKAEISAAGLEGTWSGIEHGHCSRTKRGGGLSWFPSRGTVLVQGSKEGKDEISARLSNGPKYVEATPAAPYRAATCRS